MADAPPAAASRASGWRAWLQRWAHGEWQAMQDWLGKANPWPRWPLLLIMLYLAWTISFTPGKEGIFTGINLGIHEAGHLLTTWAPKIVCSAAGSFFQCAAPIVAMVILRKQDDWAGVSFCLLWLGTNFNHVSWYMADAVEMKGHLLTVGGGGAPVPKEEIHDWHVIFSKLGLLDLTPLISGATYAIGFLCMWLAVGLIAYQLYKMHKRSAG